VTGLDIWKFCLAQCLQNLWSILRRNDRVQLYCGRLSATDIVKFILGALKWPDNESTTHHFASIFQNTSGFHPEIAVRRITGSIVSVDVDCSPQLNSQR
jgi:hypothetical protein